MHTLLAFLCLAWKYRSWHGPVVAGWHSGVCQKERAVPLACLQLVHQLCCCSAVWHAGHVHRASCPDALSHTIWPANYTFCSISGITMSCAHQRMPVTAL